MGYHIFLMDLSICLLSVFPIIIKPYEDSNLSVLFTGISPMFKIVSAYKKILINIHWINEWTRSELNDEFNKLDQTFWNRIMERNVNLFTKLDELNVKKSSL